MINAIDFPIFNTSYILGALHLSVQVSQCPIPHRVKPFGRSNQIASNLVFK